MSDAFKPALHGRDHCPGGVDPIPCFTGLPYADMYWFFSGGTAVADSTFTNFVDLGSATAGASSDTSVFDASDLATGNITWDGTAQHGAPALARAGVVWSQTSGALGPRQVSMTVSAAYELTFDLNNAHELTMTNPGGDIAAYQEVHQFFFLGRQSEESIGDLVGGLYHEMGGDRDVIFLSISIARLSAARPLTATPDETYFP